MRALKILVVVMGVLLIGGTAALVAAIIERVNHRRAEPVAATAPAGRGFERVVIDLPAGAHVLGTEVAGDRIVVRVGLASGGEELMLLDPHSGARLGTIELRPAAGEARR
jgi:hypothetical protein